jgi:hypothetical protein
MDGRTEGKIARMSRTDDARFAEASLDGPADPDAEAAWDVEIERRIEAIDAGTIPLESWSTVKRRIEQKILGNFSRF